MFLTVDFGSTNFKAAVFDSELQRLGESSWQLNYLSHGVEVELAEEEVLAALRHLVASALQGAGAKPSDVRAVGVTSQAQTFAVAAPDMRLKTPFVSWLDKRAAATAEQAGRDPRLHDFARHASSALSPSLQLCLAKHVFERVPGLDPEADLVVPLPSHFIHQLSGELVTDNNIASMSGFHSLPENGWWDNSLRFAGLSRKQLPALRELGKVSTRTAANPHGLPAGIPVFSAGNDQTAGAYGAEIHVHDAVLITLGTAQVAYRCYPALPEPNGRPMMRGPYPGGRFYKLGVSSFGGGLVSIAIKAEPELKDFPTFFRLAGESAPPPPGAAALPDHATNTVAWSGGPLAPGQKAKLVLDFLTDEMAKLVEALEPEGGRPVLCAGGGNKSRLWVETLERKLGTPLTPVENDPLQGAAALMRDASLA